MNLKKFITSKNRKNFTQIIGYSIRSLSLSISNFIISLLVIRLASIQLWGEFVYILIFVNLAAHIMAWGNVGFLFREFSRKPSKIVENWQKNLVTRSLIFAFFIILLLLSNIQGEKKLLVLFWSLAIFLYRSYDIFIFYYRKYTLSTLLEGGGIFLFVFFITFFKQTLDLNILLFIFGIINFVKLLIISYSFRKDLFKRNYSKFEKPMLMAIISVIFN